MQITRETLIQIGGSEWQRDEKRRIYFNDLMALAGIEAGFFKSSRRVSFCRIDGVGVSHSAGERAINSLPTKLWWDVLTQQFCSLGSDALVEKIVSAITARV